MAMMIRMLSLMSMSDDDGDDGNDDVNANSSKVLTMADILCNSRIINQEIIYFPKSVFNQFSKIK